MMTMGVVMGHTMKTVSAAEFKAKCLRLMDEVERSGEAITVTKRGRPVAQLAPVPRDPEAIFGFLKGRMKIVGDIEGPLDEDWEALR
jgi:prevent-host-death family protein